jgi:tRNA threonylcarbamoyl adenosine modification protein (Sua5/YciO/YrdC/YwlC family)
MADYIKLHPESPQQNRIFELADGIRKSAVVLLPTDSRYALACDYQNKKGIDRIRQIRGNKKKLHLTVLCESLEHVSTFARMDDRNFKLIKRLIPGPYTFILPATREVPRLLVHEKKKTVGIRVPDYPICLDLVRVTGFPLLAISAKLPGENEHENNISNNTLFLESFENQVDIIVDNEEEYYKDEETTILDMTGDTLKVLRAAQGMDKLREVTTSQGYELQMDDII